MIRTKATYHKCLSFFPPLLLPQNNKHFSPFSPFFFHSEMPSHRHLHAAITLLPISPVWREATPRYSEKKRNLLHVNEVKWSKVTFKLSCAFSIARILDTCLLNLPSVSHNEEVISHPHQLASKSTSLNNQRDLWSKIFHSPNFNMVN